MNEQGTPHGVLLMTYGSPRGPEEMGDYLARIRGGRPAAPELVDEFRRRYAAIGGSPLIPITRQQAAALARRLGSGWAVEIGMRFSDPTIAQGVVRLAERGVQEAIGIILSPQYSPLVMSGYGRALDAAREEFSSAPAVTVAGAWHRQPAFLEALATRVRAALDRFAAGERDSVPVLFTAHSLPRRVAEQEPDYLEQLRETAWNVAERAGLAEGRWRFCWQSAGHEPGEWMKPDFAELLPALRDDGHQSVLVAPIQFLSEHLEILYDLDIGARKQAEEAGMRFERIASLNADPLLIDALASVAAEALAPDRLLETPLDTRRPATPEPDR